jgi:TPR repeat protein
MYLLGYCFENGVGTDKDMTQARAWYQMAARAGNGEARLWITQHADNP